MATGPPARGGSRCWHDFRETGAAWPTTSAAAAGPSGPIRTTASRRGRRLACLRRGAGACRRALGRALPRQCRRDAVRARSPGAGPLADGCRPGMGRWDAGGGHPAGAAEGAKADRTLFGMALRAIAPTVPDDDYWRRLVAEGHAQRLEASLAAPVAMASWRPGDRLRSIPCPKLVLGGAGHPDLRADRGAGGPSPRRRERDPPRRRSFAEHRGPGSAREIPPPDPPGIVIEDRSDVLGGLPLERHDDCNLRPAAAHCLGRHPVIQGVLMSLIDLLLGRPLATEEQSERKIGVLAGIPALGLDGLSSSAYGPEAALTVLLPTGRRRAGATSAPSLLVILALLTILYFSYRQTIAAYPGGGGSYTVATREPRRRRRPAGRRGADDRLRPERRGRHLRGRRRAGLGLPDAAAVHAAALPGHPGIHHAREPARHSASRAGPSCCRRTSSSARFWPCPGDRRRQSAAGGGHPMPVAAPPALPAATVAVASGFCCELRQRLHRHDRRRGRQQRRHRLPRARPSPTPSGRSPPSS